MARGAFTRVMAWLMRYRIIVIACYAFIVPTAALVAMRIPTDVSINRLIVPNDPDYAATREFQRIFPEPQLVLLVFEADDPWTPTALARIDRAKVAVARVPHVATFSVVDALRRARPGADPAALRDLAYGTSFFRHQGLVGDHFLTVIASLDTHDPDARDTALDGIDDALARAGVGPVRKIGAPYISSWLEHKSSSATRNAFVIFAILLVAITLFLYRSVRALLAILISLGTAVALAMAAGSVLGFGFTIVSGLVPLTIMVTTLATLTYLHSRFVDQPDDLPLEEHQLAALRNKLLPVTASTIAAAAGFIALSVSTVQPIRELGIWTGVGLLLTWIVAYTLFPALQLVLKTPTGRKVKVRSAVYDRIARGLPGFTYRHRGKLVASAVGLGVAGVLAITGVPGVFGNIPIEVDGLANVDRSTGLYHDMKWFHDHVMDLNIARVWVHLPRGNATDPDVLQAIDRFQSALETTPGVTGVAGPVTPLRMRSYFAGHGDRLPHDPEQFAAAVADVEQLMMTEADLRAFIDVDGLQDYQITVLYRDGGAAIHTAIVERIRGMWAATLATSPALAGARMHVVGEALLQAKVGASLVPTLAESFLLTVAFIFVVFVMIFRSGLERLLAMIPSVTALLVTFLGLRLFGGSLNIATIIIATTVLGTTENDQLHFFHHMHERAGSALEIRLRHALRVSGRAVVFATLINAVGFLGLSTSSFPPLREFGLMTAAAFVFALIADFTVLPAAMWIASGERPDPGAGATPASDAGSAEARAQR